MTNFTTRQQMDETMQAIKKDQTTLAATCSAITVTDEASMGIAAEVLAQVKGRIKRIEDKRTEYVKPLNDTVKTINADFKAAAAPYLEMEKQLKGAIGTFVDAQRKAAAEEQRRLEAERSKEADKLAKEEGISRRAALAQIDKPVVEAQTTSVTTDTAKVVTKLVAKFEVVNPENVPAEYKIVDERLIRKAVQGGARRIPGVKIWEETTVSGFAE